MKTSMKKTLMNRMVLGLTLALAFVALLGLLRSAEAKVVVRASVVTPVLQVHASNGRVTPVLRGGCVVPPAPEVILVGDRRPRPRTRTRVVRNHRGIVRKLRHEDRRIARRLQRATGIDKDIMLGFRRAGWTWPEIAFELRIRRAELAHAMNNHRHGNSRREMELCSYQFNHR